LLFGTLFDIPSQQKQLSELENKLAAAGFWDDPESAQEVVQRLKEIKSVVAPVGQLSSRIDDLAVLHELAIEADSLEDLEAAAAEADEVANQLERLELRTLLSGPHDTGNCYFSIHSGAGGTESCDWASMLMRMYLRYFERSGWTCREMDLTEGEETGVRSCALHVKGPCAYGYLSCERGVHRLVRISPFDSQNRRHTSFASVDVMPELKDIDVKIDFGKDVREDTYRASGAGGQHVNKTSSAVRLTHISTGIVTQCQNERSQHKNRAEARKMLAAKLYQHEQAQRDAELAKLYSDKGEIAFGNHIRSYVLYPYRLVRDERSELKSPHTDRVLDGDLQEFIDAYLRHRATTARSQ